MSNIPRLVENWRKLTVLADFLHIRGDHISDPGKFPVSVTWLVHHHLARIPFSPAKKFTKKNLQDNFDHQHANELQKKLRKFSLKFVINWRTNWEMFFNSSIDHEFCGNSKSLHVSIQDNVYFYSPRFFLFSFLNELQPKSFRRTAQHRTVEKKKKYMEHEHEMKKPNKKKNSQHERKKTVNLRIYMDKTSKK